MREYYSATLDEFASGLENFTKRIDGVNARLDHFKNLLSLTGQSRNYSMMDKILRGQMNAADTSRSVAKSEYELAKKERERWEAELAAATSQAEHDAIVPQLNRARELELEAEQNLMEAREKYLELANEVYKNATEEALYLMELANTKGKGYDALNQSLDLASKYQDEYLTKTNQVYETTKLLHDLAQDIDKTDNQAAKSKLKNFASEIESMREQGELSQLDLKIAQARYEVLKAQISLEEAQNAKSIVRMQRDNEGNYGYVFTADRDDIDKAEQELASKSNDLYNLVLENTNNYQRKIIELDQEFNKAVADIANDTTLTEEEKEQRLLELKERYGAIRLSYEEQLQTAMLWLGRTGIEGVSEAYTQEFHTQIQNTHDWYDTASTTINNINSEYSALKDIMVDDEDVNQALHDMDQDLKNVKTELNGINTEAQNYINKSKTMITAIHDETAEWTKLQETLEKTLKFYQDIINTANMYWQQESTSPTDWSVQSGIHIGNKEQQEKDYAQRETILKANPGLLNDESILSTDKVRKVNDYMESVYGDNAGNHMAWLFSEGATYKQLYDDLHNWGVKGFATGGYTGDWSDSGKLAFLHQKELVLNEDDTKNLLAGVGILRGITNAIDLQALWAGTGSISSPGYNSGKLGLAQNIVINADFPNATNHYEIEEAFNNILNRASQFANR